MLMLYYVYKNYLTYIWIKFTVFLRENCAEQGANKAVFDALFVLSLFTRCLMKHLIFFLNSEIPLFEKKVYKCF